MYNNHAADVNKTIIMRKITYLLDVQKNKYDWLHMYDTMIVLNSSFEGIKVGA